MKKKIETSNAPKAIGPYSQGIVVEAGTGLLFVSGQLPVNPETGKLLEGDIQALTRQVIQNIEAILNAASCGLEDVIRTDVFLKDLKRDFAAMNEEYAKFFNGASPPARQTVQVSELPMGSPIEISCIAIRKNLS